MVLYIVLNLCTQKNFYMTKQQKLEKVNLNWNVKAEKLVTESGIVIPNHVAIIREDTQHCLSVRKDGYQPYQNEQLFDLLEKVSSKTGLKIKKGGYFGDGEKVYIQMKSDDLVMPNNDKVEGYVTGINSFDGSTSLAFGNSTITISCMNTFFASYRELNSKIRHTKNMLMKIDDICNQVDKNLEEETKLFERIKRMSEVKMDAKVKELVVRALFDIDSKLPKKNWEKELSTNVKNKMQRFEMDLQTEVAQKEDSLWGLFSGVTRFTTHSITKNDNTETKLFGIYGARERKIFDEILN